MIASLGNWASDEQAVVGCCIATRAAGNGWNRLMITTRVEPGRHTADKFKAA